MQRISKVILIVALIAAVFSGTATGANAAVTNLPAGILIGDQDGIRIDVDGAYFINADALEAGDVITKRLVIRNTESYAYRVSMTAESLEETGPLHLLDEVHCTLKMDGKVLYNGRVRGNDGINIIRNALDLGTYQSGDQKTLDITLTVNKDMKQYAWTASEAFFKWIFYAVQDDGGSGGPNTGGIIRNSLFAVMPGLVLAMVVLLLIKRRREDQTKVVT